jgi:hypothetical protein
VRMCLATALGHVIETTLARGPLWVQTQGHEVSELRPRIRAEGGVVT